MHHTIPTYTLRTEAISVAPERLLYVNGGGNASGLISSDYSKMYSLLRVLYVSVSSRLFRVYTYTNNNTNFNLKVQ